MSNCDDRLTATSVRQSSRQNTQSYPNLDVHDNKLPATKVVKNKRKDLLTRQLFAESGPGLFDTQGTHNFNWKSNQHDDDMNLELFELKRNSQSLNPRGLVSSTRLRNVNIDYESSSNCDDADEFNSNIDDVYTSVSDNCNNLDFLLNTKGLKVDDVEEIHDSTIEFDEAEDVDDDLVDIVIRNFGEAVMTDGSIEDLKESNDELEESQILEDVFFVKV